MFKVLRRSLITHEYHLCKRTEMSQKNQASCRKNRKEANKGRSRNYFKIPCKYQIEENAFEIHILRHPAV